MRPAGPPAPTFWEHDMRNLAADVARVAHDALRNAGRASLSLWRSARAPVAGVVPTPRPPHNGDRQALAELYERREPALYRQALAADLAKLEDSMSARQSLHAGDIALVHPDHRADAVNLTHYLALRQGDERSLQRRLGELGLSSLGRCEPHVLATVESVRSALDASTSVPVPPLLSFEEGRAALDRNTDALFGPRPRGRVPRVMVTLPSEAATDHLLVRHLVSSGMDVARINGAHDDPDRWEEMARNVRKAAVEVGRPCRISMDLP